MSMKLGNATVMASDGPESRFNKPQGFRISISRRRAKSSTASTTRWRWMHNRSR
jgi:hypothetical protein